MASSAGIRAGRAFVELSLQDGPLRKGLDAAAARLKTFGASVGAIGVGLAGLGSSIVAPMLAAVKAFSDAGSEIADASARTGISAEALQEYKFAAEQTGATLEELEVGIKKMQKAIVEAGQGSKSATEDLARLGLTAADLAGETPEEQFEMIAEAISKIEDPAERAAASMAIFGKSGTSLLGMMAGGAKGIQAFAAEARALGIVLTDEDIQAADKFGDAMDSLKTQTMAVALQVGAALVPMLLEFVNAAKVAAKIVIDFVRENRALVVTVFTVGAALLAAGTAMIGVGTAIAGLGFVFTGISAAIGAAGAAVAFLMTPFGLVLAAIAAVSAALAALGVWFFTSTEMGKTALSGLMSFVGETFGAIKDALDAKQYELAANILWASLLVAFETGIAPLIQALNAISNAWDAIIDSMIDSWAQFLALATAAGQGLGLVDGQAVDTLNAAQAGIDARAAARKGVASERDAAAAKRLADARAERDALIGEVIRKPKGAGVMSSPYADPDPAAAVKMRFNTQGSFSARAASLAFGGTDPGKELKDIAKEQLKVQQEIAKNTKKPEGAGTIGIL